VLPGPGASVLGDRPSGSVAGAIGTGSQGYGRTGASGFGPGSRWKEEPGVIRSHEVS
jgi:hypothetical protein